ncbi:MAG: N-acetyltransferase [Planctomycetota bacterium]
MLAATGPEEQLVVLDGSDRLVGRCSLWCDGTPELWGETTGLIGHYAVSSREASDALLDEAVRWIKARGAALAVGPMDGSTWNPYRLITERGSRPAFLMEPDHPEAWPGYFRGAGFVPAAEYFSSGVEDLTRRQPKYERLERRLQEQGMRIEPFDPDRFEAELGEVYELSVEAFADNLMYTPISREAFLGMYEPLRGRLVPELVLMARQDGVLKGYVFAVPDALQAQRGEPIDTVVVKTLAVRRGRAIAGLGGVLLERCHLAAHGLGFRGAIHALMHETNKSKNLSGFYGPTFRRYTLFYKRVAR